jgi:hypothetical protein
VTLPLSYSRSLAGGERRIRTFVGQSPADLQSAAFDRSAISPRICFGAGDGTRTRDLLITNQLLYQLSYASVRQFFKDTISLYRWSKECGFAGATEEQRLIAEFPNGTQAWGYFRHSRRRPERRNAPDCYSFLRGDGPRSSRRRAAGAEDERSVRGSDPLAPMIGRERLGCSSAIDRSAPNGYCEDLRGSPNF